MQAGGDGDKWELTGALSTSAEDGKNRQSLRSISTRHFQPPPAQHAKRRRHLSGVLAIVVVQFVFLFVLLRCYRSGWLRFSPEMNVQSRRLAEAPPPPDEAAACSTGSGGRSTRSPAINAEEGERRLRNIQVDEVSADVTGASSLRPEVQVVASMVATTAAHGLVRDEVPLLRQLDILLFPEYQNSYFGEDELQLIIEARKLIAVAILERRRQARDFRQAVQASEGLGELEDIALSFTESSDSDDIPPLSAESFGVSASPEESSEQASSTPPQPVGNARLELLRSRRALTRFIPTSLQISRPLLLAARFELAKRAVPDRLLEALAAAECITRKLLSPKRFSGYQEKLTVLTMARQTLNAAHLAAKRLTSRLSRIPDNPLRQTPEMLRELEWEISCAEEIIRDTVKFNRRLRLLDRSTAIRQRVAWLDEALSLLMRKKDEAEAFSRRARRDGERLSI